MQQMVRGVAVEGTEHPATDAPGLYLIGAALPGLAVDWGQQPARDTQCLVCLMPLKRPAVRSTPERTLHLRDTLAAGSASHNAAVLAREPYFWDYLQQISLTAYDAEIDSRRARHFINQVCGVTGRHELDHNPATAQRFFSFIQRPFLGWLLAAMED